MFSWVCFFQHFCGAWYGCMAVQEELTWALHWVNHYLTQQCLITSGVHAGVDIHVCVCPCIPQVNNFAYIGVFWAPKSSESVVALSMLRLYYSLITLSKAISLCQIKVLYVLSYLQSIHCSIPPKAQLLHILTMSGRVWLDLGSCSCRHDIDPFIYAFSLIKKCWESMFN